jgi:hypothetical protein
VLIDAYRHQQLESVPHYKSGLGFRPGFALMILLGLPGTATAAIATAAAVLPICRAFQLPQTLAVDMGGDAEDYCSTVTIHWPEIFSSMSRKASPHPTPS